MPLALTLLELAPSQSLPHRLPEKGPDPPSCDCGVQIISNSLSQWAFGEGGSFHTALRLGRHRAFLLSRDDGNQTSSRDHSRLLPFSEFRRLSRISSFPPLLFSALILISLPYFNSTVRNLFVLQPSRTLFPLDTSTTKSPIEKL